MEDKISIVDNDICVDIEELKKIITKDWQGFEKYYHEKGYSGEDLYRNILGEIADYADGLAYRIEQAIQKKLGRPNDRLDWSDLYQKSDVRSIGFKVLNFLETLWGESPEILTIDDIPIILEFLDTPSDKSLEAWDKWEKYWANLNYPERLKKLLKKAEQ